MTPEGDFQRAVYRAGELEANAINRPSYDLQRENADLAERIEKFWHARGYLKVKVWVERERQGEDAVALGKYCVRSNLINGVPPR